MTTLGVLAYEYKRPRRRFARSYAYVEQEGVRRVTGAGLLVAYAQVQLLALLARGVDRPAASTASWRLFFNRLVPATGEVLLPIPPEVQFRSPRCLAESAEGLRDALGLEWDDFVARHGAGPVALLHPDDAAELVWLLETVRRVAEGGELLEAARGAHDAHEGRPRRRRAPVEAGWLQPRLEVVTEHAWWALLHTTGPFGMPWLTARWVAEDAPPRAEADGGGAANGELGRTPR